MATFVIAHGAWSAGWFWKKMHPLLTQRGHRLFTPTYTGIGERSHLAHRGISLESHIEDLLKVLEYEDLRNIVLVGHSYGGMVATGVGDRAWERIAQVIYLDAFVPRDGESVFSLMAENTRQAFAAAADRDGDGWRLPANPMPPDVSAEDLAWAMPRRVTQPIETFRQPIRLSGKIDQLPRSYVYCAKFGPGDVFRPFADRARTDPAWRYFEMAASHNPQVTMPEALADLLCGIANPQATA
jgi:hypothetical protein